MRVVGVRLDTVARIIHADDFAGPDVPDESGSDHVKRAGFGSQDIGPVAQLPQGEGAESVGIQGPDHAVPGHEEVGKTTMHLGQGLFQSGHEVGVV